MLLTNPEIVFHVVRDVLCARTGAREICPWCWCVFRLRLLLLLLLRPVGVPFISLHMPSFFIIIVHFIFSPPRAFESHSTGFIVCSGIACKERMLDYMNIQADSSRSSLALFEVDKHEKERNTRSSTISIRWNLARVCLVFVERGQNDCSRQVVDRIRFFSIAIISDLNQTSQSGTSKQFVQGVPETHHGFHQRFRTIH